MFLRMRAQAAHTSGNDHPIEAVFDTNGGTMGRDPRCQMVLVDPMRRISRIQGQVVLENGVFHLINASTSNPIYVDGRELRPGEKSAIGAREEWRTGNYLIMVESSQSAAGAGANGGAVPQNLAPSAPQVATPVAALVTPSVAAAVVPQPFTPTPSDAASPMVGMANSASVDPLALVQPHAPAPAIATATSPVIATQVVESFSPAAAMKGPFDDLLGAPVPAGLASIPAAPLSMLGAGGVNQPLNPQHADPFNLAPIASPMAQTPRSNVSSDPFADLMGAPINDQVALAANGPMLHAHGKVTMIPDDFNPLAARGVSPRNTDDPLSEVLRPGSMKEMFPEKTVDSIFDPSGGSIDTMTRDPLQASQHERFMDVSNKMDPLAMFSGERTEDSLNPEFLFANGNVEEKSISDHRTEIGSYFRAPRPMAPSEVSATTPGVAPDLSAFEKHLDFHAVPEPAAPPAPVDVALQAAEVPLAAPEMDFALPLHESRPVDPPREMLSQPEPRPPAPAGVGPAVNIDALFDLGDPSDAGADLIGASFAAPVAGQASGSEPMEFSPPAPSIPPSVEPLQSQPQAIIPPTIPLEEPRAHAAAPEAAKADGTVNGVNTDYAHELLEAFKNGAGLTDCRYPQQITPELMFMVGRMLSTSVQGSMDLLSSRAVAKQEVRIAVTLINAEANNPLKFLPTGASALAQIFGPKMPGFMTGPAAIANAHQDLRSHEVAMMAGMQAVLQGMFERFDPQAIEDQLDAQGKQRTLFNAQRQAKLWDIYRTRYQWLRDEMKNQTPASWGHEFHGAYQSETDSIANKGPGK